MPTVHMNFSVPSIRVDWYISDNDKKINITNDAIPIDITTLEKSISLSFIKAPTIVRIR